MTRVLVVNAASLFSGSATGITVRSLLDSYDDLEYFELYWSGENGKIYQARSIKLKSPFLSARFLLAPLQDRRLNKALKNATSSEATGDDRYRSFIKLALSYIRQYVVLKADESRVLIPQKTMECIVKFSPEVIYTLGGSVSALALTNQLSRRLSIPIVIHYMDNWKECIQWEDNPLLKGYTKKLRRLDRECIRRSPCCITISPMMAEHYYDLTGIEHISAMNAVDSDGLLCKERVPNQSRFTFVYAGGLHLNRAKALASFARVAGSVTKTTGIEIILRIHTSNSNAEANARCFDGIENVEFRPYVSHDKIKTVYEDADALVHVEWPSPVMSRFFKYSVSTKVPEYLATGKPTILFIPRNMKVYDMIENEGIAFCADSEELLYERVRAVVTNRPLCETVTQKAVSYCREHFDQAVARESFRYVLTKASTTHL